MSKPTMHSWTVLAHRSRLALADLRLPHGKKTLQH